MGIEYRAWSAPRGWKPYRLIFPALAGVLLLASSLEPWLTDPLGERYSAWGLSVDLGWQIQSPFFNFGLLSLACACYIMLIVFRSWKTISGKETDLPARSVSSGRFLARQALLRAAFVSLIPAGLFFWQYLFVDLSAMADLARHTLQASLIKTNLGYGSAATFLLLDLTKLDSLSLDSRVALLVNNLGIGVFLPGLSFFLLLISRVFWPKEVVSGAPPLRRGRLWWTLGALALFGVLLGRGPAALVSDFQAEHALSVGSYAKALSWLDTARTLNPELDQLTAYHIERGQAWYYLRPGEDNEEAMVYLASTYVQQKDYLSSYEELTLVLHRYGNATWINDAFSTTLSRLAEQTKPLTGAQSTRLSKDNPALPWLLELVQLDPDNAYGHYMLGRIFYDEHNYTSSISQMQSTLDLVKNPDLESVAYTYLGLNSEMLGSPTQARNFLFKAVDLDYGYHNNTARQELSGIR